MIIFEPRASELTDIVYFDPNSEQMWIHFLDTDTIWLYSDITYDAFFEMVSAKSLGEYFNENVRNNFKCVKVDSMPQ